MTKKIILFLAPLILLAEVQLFSWIVELVRQPSDSSVMAGFGLLCLGVLSNYYLIKTIQKQLKQTTR
ncbi:MAG: hypothetical protein ACK4UP_06015 [Spirosomataceae bacterium]